MDKEKILAALYAIQNGDKDAGCFHDEIETLIGIVVEMQDSIIETAWTDLQTDTE